MVEITSDGEEIGLDVADAHAAFERYNEAHSDWDDALDRCRRNGEMLQRRCPICRDEGGLKPGSGVLRGAPWALRLPGAAVGQQV